MLKQIRTYSLAVGLLALPGLLAGCGGKKAAQGSSDAAVIPGANVVMSFDIATARKSAMYGKIKALQDEQGAAVPGALAIKGMDETAQMASEILGLGDEDVVRATFSAKLLGENMAAIEEDLDENLEFAVGIEVAKPVSLDQVEAFVKAVVAKQEKPLNITRAKLAGGDALMLDEGDDDDHICLVLQAGGKLVLGGTKSGVENAIARAAKPAPLAKAVVGSGLPEGRKPMWFMSLVLSDSMKAELNEKTAAPADGNPMQANLAKCFQNMSGAALTVDMAETLDLAVYAKLASAENATMLKGLFDNMAMPAVKMGATMLTGGQPLPLLDSMATSSTGDTASLKLSVTTADLDTLGAAAKAQPSPMVPEMPDSMQP